MKTVGKLVLIAVFMLTLPLAAMADGNHGKKMDMDHGSMKGMKGMDHDKMKGMDHGDMKGMKMDGDMIMLGNDSDEGIKAMAHAKVYDQAGRDALAKMGMNSTHHLMLMFTDEKTGKPVTEGKVAVKVKREGGEESKPVMLMAMKMGMGAGFGGDISLPEKGEYEIKVGTRLADGKKRQFKFEIEVK
ncbi:hypothetical protein [Geothermobacter hydrogeniphilus]|uniref:YtkA-like domain-containing protein n=1 Tax=Geothermobacter hydrogeniphilus TaxID=1969733 RepID=A0A1X0Y5S9_9BACT|nr:hypothetical protein [Geothermobacter hydrogeniphilus]ORJ60503.1 hypothetical protein B5V00_08040 [Geothermobacter hydrogeniphilus]